MELEEDDSSNGSSSRQPTTTTPDKRRKGNKSVDRETDRCASILEKACEQLDNFAQKRASATSMASNDDNQLYAMHVAESLRLIENDRHRGLCKLKIEELLFQFRFNPPCEPQPYNQQYQQSFNSNSNQTLPYHQQINPRPIPSFSPQPTEPQHTPTSNHLVYHSMQPPNF